MESMSDLVERDKVDAPTVDVYSQASGYMKHPDDTPMASFDPAAPLFPSVSGASDFSRSQMRGCNTKPLANHRPMRPILFLMRMK